MWVRIKTAGCIGNAHAIQQGDSLPAGVLTGCSPVQAQRLGHLMTHGVHRIQRSHGLLENHADPVATQAAQGIVRSTHQLVSVKPDAAIHRGVVWQQAHQRQSGDRFAAARFPNQAQGFTARQ